MTQLPLSFESWCEENQIALTNSQKEAAAAFLNALSPRMEGRLSGKTFVLRALDRFLTERSSV